MMGATDSQKERRSNGVPKNPDRGGRNRSRVVSQGSEVKKATGQDTERLIEKKEKDIGVGNMVGEEREQGKKCKDERRRRERERDEQRGG